MGNKIEVKGIEVAYTKTKKEDFVSITDIAKFGMKTILGLVFKSGSRKFLSSAS